jgi:hypothetical protein
VKISENLWCQKINWAMYTFIPRARQYLTSSHFPMPLELYATMSRMQMLVDGENLNPDTAEDGEGEDVRFSSRRHEEVSRLSSPSVSESKFS